MIEFIYAKISQASRVVALCAAWLVVPLVFLTVLEVLLRYFFHAPTSWSFELCYMLTGTHFLLGLADTLQKDGHVRIDLFYARYSPKWKAIVNVISLLLLGIPAVCFVGWLLWAYWYEALINNERSGLSAWNPVVWPYRLVFFLALFLLALQMVAEAAKGVLQLVNRHSGLARD